MAEQLGVVGRDDERRPAGHRPGDPLDLSLAVEHEVAGVLGRPLHRHAAVVGRLRAEADRAGDAVVLDARVVPLAERVQVRPDVVVAQQRTPPFRGGEDRMSERPLVVLGEQDDPAGDVLADLGPRLLPRVGDESRRLGHLGLELLPQLVQNAFVGLGRGANVHRERSASRR